MSNTTPFIVTETPKGRISVKSSFICYGESDFIGRIATMAARSDEVIDSVHAAIEYLNDRSAQRTAIVRRDDFDALTPDSWDSLVREKAESLGWYETQSKEDDQ